jgi:hypothetical protein
MCRNPLTKLAWGNSASTCLGNNGASLRVDRLNTHAGTRQGFMKTLWHSTDSGIEPLRGSHVLSVQEPPPARATAANRKEISLAMAETRKGPALDILRPKPKKGRR